MRLLVVAAGSKLPEWVNLGFEEYAARLTRDYRLELKEIALGQRPASGATSQAITKEGEKMLAAIPSGAFVVALQVGGKNVSSPQLAQFLQQRSLEGRDVVFCIGGDR